MKLLGSNKKGQSPGGQEMGKGRKTSMKEAREIAFDIAKEAEQKRLEYFKEEAERNKCINCTFLETALKDIKRECERYYLENTSIYKIVIKALDD